MDIKRCSDCGRFLSEDAFYWRNKKKGYLKSYCKRCSSNRFHLWELDNPEYSKQWRKNNLNYIKQWREDNKKHLKEYNRQRYENNKEYLKEYYKQHHQNNKKRYNKYSKRWALDNPGKACAKSMKRYAQTPELTEIERNRINFIYEVASTIADYQVDHVTPLSRGGLHHPDNLQILDKQLNLQKSDKYPLTEEERMKYKGLKV